MIIIVNLYAACKPKATEAMAVAVSLTTMFGHTYIFI